MYITIVLLISRDLILDRLFVGLELLDCNKETTTLLAIVDGDDKNLYVKARNLVQQSKFAGRLCIQHKSKPVGKYSIPQRRKRISDLHNMAKLHVPDCEYVFLTEDDTVLPSNSLTNLLKAYSLHPFAGLIQGAELGRWGAPYVGAFKADDVYEPTEFTSLMPSRGVEPIDVGGFYCTLTKTKSYKMHEHKPFEDVLGPDADYGIAQRRFGTMNYIDWSVSCDHYTNNGDPLSIATVKPVQISLHKQKRGWNQLVTTFA